MPLSSKLVLRDAYCSAPPLTSSLRPPRLSRAKEARRPRAPFRPVKQEVNESEDSVEFVVDKDEWPVKCEWPVKRERPVDPDRPVTVEQDPRQIVLGIAPIAIRQPASSASTSSEEAPGPSSHAHRTQALCCVPPSQLGPADPPRGKGRPKGSKSRPRIPILFGLSTLPKRAASVKRAKASRR